MVKYLPNSGTYLTLKRTAVVTAQYNIKHVMTNRQTNSCTNVSESGSLFGFHSLSKHQLTKTPTLKANLLLFTVQSTFSSSNPLLSLCDKATLWTHMVHMTNSYNTMLSCVKRSYFLLILQAVKFKRLLMFPRNCSLLMLWTERFFSCVFTLRVYNAKLCFLVTV